MTRCHTNHADSNTIPTCQVGVMICRGRFSTAQHGLRRECPQRESLTFFLLTLIPTSSFTQERAPLSTHSFGHGPLREKELIQRPADSLFPSESLPPPESPDAMAASPYALQSSAGSPSERKPPYEAREELYQEREKPVLVCTSFDR